MPKDCPACGVTNTDTAILCDCQWSFTEGRSLRPVVLDQREVDRALDEIIHGKPPSRIKQAAKWTAIVVFGLAAAGGGLVPLSAYIVALAALKYLMQKPSAQPPV
jgi:hypothetical protein